MGFTKLDEGILQSSVMAESAKTFKVWIALLASCRENGISQASSVFLASACHLTLKDIDRALEVLEAPDSRSRSLEDEGRRIKRVDGGYYIVNYFKYRAYSHSGNPEAVRKREYRNKEKVGHLGHVPKCPDISASASVSSSASSFSLTLNLHGWRWEGITGEDLAAWAKAYPACDIDRELLAMVEWAKSNPAKAVKKNYRRFIVNWLARSQEKGGGMKSISPGKNIYGGLQSFLEKQKGGSDEPRT